MTGIRDGRDGKSDCKPIAYACVGDTGDFNFATGMCDGGDDWSNGIVSGEFWTDLQLGLDDDSSDDFLISSSHVSSLLVP